MAHTDFESDVYPRTVAAVGRRVVEQRTPRPWLRWMWLIAAPAAAVLLFAIGRGTWVDPRTGNRDLRTKGPADGHAEVALEIFAKRGNQVFAVSPGTPLRPGDAIRFVVRRPQQLGNVLVVAVGADRHVSVYVPYGGKTSQSVGIDAARVEIDGSLVLDGGQGPERIFAFFGSAPFTIDAIEAALTQLAAGGPAAIRAGTHVDVRVEAQASALIERSAS